MPIYEYQCSACGRTVEKIQRQAEATIPCPACGQQARRAVSLFAAGAETAGGGCASSPGSGFG